MRTGGQILVDQLVVHGADVAFGVPGESYLAVLDALHDAPIRFVSCRHEVGAANMADAYGKLTGQPGICMVTRGPGATHAAGGVHTAYQDSTPLILLIGQVGREMMGREAFQEIDYRQMFGPMAKWVAQIDSADRIPELLSRAFHVATSGRPGPVVLALPEDMLVDRTSEADAAPYTITRVHPADADVEEARTLLAGAERPLVIVGGAPWSCGGERGAHRLVRCRRSTRRIGMALPGLRRQHRGRLRRAPRARSRPAPCSACAGCRRPPRDRRPAQRDHDLRVHAPRGAIPGTGTRSRHRGPERARPRLHAHARHRRISRVVRRVARRHARARPRRPGGRDTSGACRLPREPRPRARSG